MKHIDHFAALLRDTINLNQSRIDTLEKRVEVIENFLSKSAWSPAIQDYRPQGSWAHKTIIKPPTGEDFDADVVVFVTPVEGWSAKQYVNSLVKIFTDSGTYNSLVKPSSRCATLDYAGDFHLDVVPCVVNRKGDGALEVCNRDSDDFESTDGVAFEAWFHERNRWVGNDNLRKVVRLLKYLRNSSAGMEVKSILLTTLVANLVAKRDALAGGVLLDTPTALKVLVDRLDDFLQANATMPLVENPVLPSETFVRHWDQQKYTDFRAAFHDIRGKIDDAYLEAERSESIRKWRLLFGDGFAADVELRKVVDIKDALMRGVKVPVQATTDAVALVEHLGRKVLAYMPGDRQLTHVREPNYTFLPAEHRQRVVIRASYGNTPFTSGAPVPKSTDLTFVAVSSAGLPFSGQDYSVTWRVVNTGIDAEKAGKLRGDFYESTTPSRRVEPTLYRGIHWVEAFVRRRRDDVCVAASDRFYVLIT